METSTKFGIIKETTFVDATTTNHAITYSETVPADPTFTFDVYIFFAQLSNRGQNLWLRRDSNPCANKKCFNGKGAARCTQFLIGCVDSWGKRPFWFCVGLFGHIWLDPNLFSIHCSIRPNWYGYTVVVFSFAAWLCQQSYCLAAGVPPSSVVRPSVSWIRCMDPGNILWEFKQPIPHISYYYLFFKMFNFHFFFKLFFSFSLTSDPMGANISNAIQLTPTFFIRSQPWGDIKLYIFGDIVHIR